MKYIFFLILIYCTMLFPLNTFAGVDSKCEKLLIEVDFFPTGVASECYIVKLDSTGFYNIKYGSRDSAQAGSIELSSVKSSKSKLLDTNDMKLVEALVNEIKMLDSIEKDHIVKGGWEVIIKSDTNILHIYFNEINLYDKSIGILINKLIELSPLKIDIHSWS